MKTLRALLTTVLVAVSLTGLARAEIYKWTDQNGGIHFGDVPPPQGRSIGEIESLPAHQQAAPEIDPPQPEAPKRKRTANQAPALTKQSSEHEEAAVELYTTSWCRYCQKAREFFHARGIPFTEYDIEADADAAQRKQEIDSRPGVPLAVINGQPILGFVPAAYAQALAGHPR